MTEILATATEHNREAQVSGILCASQSVFIQALEGRAEVVRALYNRIASDARHTGVRQLACTDIETRAFDGWSMRLVHWETRMTADQREAVLRAADLQALDADTITADQAFTFLQTLARFNRRVGDRAVG